MKRTKSSISLKNIADSLKNSINFDNRKSKLKSFIPLKSSASTFNLHQNYPYSVFGQNNWNNKQQNFLITKKRQNQMTRQTIISKLQTNQKQKNSQSLKVLQQHKQMIEQEVYHLSKITMKSYQKQLNQLDSIHSELKQINNKRCEIEQNIFQLRNQQKMHYEQVQSWNVHFEESVAERQYCEQFIQRYQEQYKQEAQIVLNMLKIQSQSIQLNKNRSQTQEQIKVLQKQYKNWKIQEEYQLKQKKFSNRLKLLRIQLMAIQQKADDIMNQNQPEHTQRKIREQICSFFKKYNQKNINYISQNQIADGIQIFICKQGLISQFQNFIKSKSKQICKKSFQFDKILNDYCQCLFKIQQFFTQKGFQVNKKISNIFNDKIIKLKGELQTNKQQIQKNIKLIKHQNQKIQQVLANESITVIQVLQNKQADNCCSNSKKSLNIKSLGLNFNIIQIKSQIKKLKAEQTQRIKSMRQTFLQLKSLQKRKAHQCVPNQTNLEPLLQQIFKQENDLQQILQIQNGFTQRKNKYDSIINSAIQKMKQAQSKKQELSNVVAQIQRLKKEKIINLTKNFKLKKSQQLRNKQNFNQFPESDVRFDFTRKFSYRESPPIFPEYGFTKSKNVFMERQSQVLKERNLKLTKSNSMKSSQFESNKKNETLNKLRNSSKNSTNNKVLKLKDTNCKRTLSQMLIQKLAR